MHSLHGCTRNRALVINGRRAYIHLIERNKRDEEMTMFGPFKKFARALRVPSVEEREMAYLNGSNDRFDLEYRQRQVDRGAFRNR